MIFSLARFHWLLIQILLLLIQILLPLNYFTVIIPEIVILLYIYIYILLK